MIPYHGSNTDIKVINLSMCRPYKDFGRGFYLTSLKEQALRMAERVARLYGGDPVLNQFELDEERLRSSGLNVMDFGQTPSSEWARFVMNNRNRKYSDFRNAACNFDNKYDVVIGPVANDDMEILFRQYENGMLPFENLMNGLVYRKTTDQYSFHTERAVSLLRKVALP